jgi:predicted transcriptional regulator
VKRRHPVALTHCPNCGTRIVPTPREMKRLRLAAGLSQREMGEILKITSSYVTYLESGERSPSATVIARYWKFRTSKRKAR